MAKFEEQSDSNNAICPYCGNQYQVECENYDEDVRQEECQVCKKQYWIYQSFSVTTHTSPDCKLNGSAHNYEWITLKNGRKAMFCTICGDCQIDKIRREK